MVCVNRLQPNTVYIKPVLLEDWLIRYIPIKIVLATNLCELILKLIIWESKILGEKMNRKDNN